MTLAFPSEYLSMCKITRTLQPIEIMMTLAAEMHNGSWSLCVACSPLAALLSLPRRTTELRVLDRGGSR